MESQYNSLLVESIPIPSQYIDVSTNNEVIRIELLHKRFRRGLQEDYGFTEEQILQLEDTWVWCGNLEKKENDSGEIEYIVHHESIFRSYFPSENEMPLPQFVEQCVCRQKLTVHNHWITNGIDAVMPIGQCCKDQFIKHRLRTCVKCNFEHRSRTSNVCVTCRKELQQAERRKKKLERELRSGKRCTCEEYKEVWMPHCVTCEDTFRRKQKEEAELKKKKEEEMIQNGTHYRCEHCKNHLQQVGTECTIWTRYITMRMEQEKRMTTCSCGRTKGKDFRQCYTCYQKQKTEKIERFLKLQGKI